jgi:hypothetical protein
LNNIKRGKLPRPPLDPIQAALAGLRKLSRTKRFERGQDYLKVIVEEVFRQPHRAGAIEEAGAMCGLTCARAEALRCEVEKAALDRATAPPPARSSDHVTINTALLERMRERDALEDRPERHGIYDPFSNDRIRGWGD